ACILERIHRGRHHRTFRAVRGIRRVAPCDEQLFGFLRIEVSVIGVQVERGHLVRQDDVTRLIVQLGRRRLFLLGRAFLGGGDGQQGQRDYGGAGGSVRQRKDHGPTP